MGWLLVTACAASHVAMFVLSSFLSSSSSYELAPEGLSSQLVRSLSPWLVRAELKLRIVYLSRGHHYPKPPVVMLGAQIKVLGAPQADCRHHDSRMDEEVSSEVRSWETVGHVFSGCK